jgi:hypothetical protein
MQAALDQNEQVKIYRQYAKLLGLGYDVKTMDTATFPAYQGSLSLLNAKIQR